MSVDVRNRRTPPVLAWLLILLSAVPVAHGNNRKPENRFLIIVETSHAAGKRSKGIAATVESLITSGIQGQAQPDDTIGIWTYNDSLTAGEFPLQSWSDGAGKHIASGMLAFLETQKYSRSARFSDAVMPALMPIVHNSEYLNVIIICTGADPIRGTPFDDQIQKSIRAWRDEQQKAVMPLAVALSVVRGRFTAFRVTPAPWRVELPPLPPELVQAQRAAPKVAAASVAKPVAMAAPLIVSGKRRDASSTPAMPTPSVPEPRLETNLPSQPNNVSAAASVAAITEAIPVTHAQQVAGSTTTANTRIVENQTSSSTQATPDTASASTSAIAAASRESQTAQVRRTASAETKPSARPDQNARSTNTPAVSALAAASGGPAITLPSPADSSVLMKRLILLIAVVSAGLGVFLVRRSHTGHVSLITHSMNRDRE
jgi:hypothetical protein